MRLRSRTSYCRRLGLLLAASCLLVACEQQPKTTDSGAMLYLRVCSTCHGQQGQGRDPAFPPLAGSEWLDLGPDAVVAITLLGLAGEIEVAGTTYRGYMPPMGHLQDEEIARIVAHVAQWAQWPDLPDAARIGQLRSAVAEHGVLQGRAGLDKLMETLPASETTPGGS